jgi:hypothetical protein
MSKISASSRLRIDSMVVSGLGRRNADNGDRLVDCAEVGAGEFCDRAGTGSLLRGWVVKFFPVGLFYSRSRPASRQSGQPRSWLAYRHVLSAPGRGVGNRLLMKWLAHDDQWQFGISEDRR